MIDLSSYEERYERIASIAETKYHRDVLLAGLMTDLENDFGISVLRPRKNKSVDPQVMAFYEMVSRERAL